MQTFTPILSLITILQGILDKVLVVTDWVWGIPMVALMVCFALFFSYYLRFFQFLNIKFIYNNTFKTYFKPKNFGDGTITPIRAVMTALAAMIGTGNITGVAVAISLGGPGALFWMFLISFFISIIKFTEIVIGIKYRGKDKESGEWRGGLMYVIQNAFSSKWKPLAYIWAGLIAIQYLFGPSIQTNSIADTLSASFNIPKLFIGIIISSLAGIILIGGIKRISEVASKLVPFMSVLYILFATVILIINARNILPSISLILSSAFGHGVAPAVAGGMAYSLRAALRNGLARGLLSNEAGMGSAPFFHAPAQTDFPARQALWGIFEVFMDTAVLCTLSGLVILSSGVYTTAAGGPSLAAQAFISSVPYFGRYMIAIAVTLFAFTSLLCDAFIGTSCFKYVFKTNHSLIYTLVIMLTIVGGAVADFGIVWSLWDTIMMFTVTVNVFVLFKLRHVVIDEMKAFFQYLKTSKEEDVSKMHLPSEVKRALD